MRKNDKKFQRFVEATRSLAYWSRELLKVIEKPENSDYQPTKPKSEQQSKGENQ